MTALTLLGVLALGSWLGCSGELDPARSYRFQGVDDPLASAEGRRVVGLYPDLLASLASDHQAADIDIRGPRTDLLHAPADERSYDALNALAVTFFELHRRAERGRDGAGFAFLTQNLRATQVLSVSWRSYRDLEDVRLRGAILDFYEDLLLGGKAGVGKASGRYVPTVESLLRWESEPGLRARIRSLVDASAGDAGAQVLEGVDAGQMISE